MLKEIEKAKLEIHFCSGKSVGVMLFADDFVSVRDSNENLKSLVDVEYSYCSKI